MVDHAIGVPLTPIWGWAYQQVDDWLMASCVGASRLHLHELRKYNAPTPVGGWRLEIEFPDAKRRVDLLLSSTFPFSPPSVALVDRPEHLSWPHIAEDGVLCLLGERDTVNATRPVEVVQRVLKEAVEWCEASIAGINKYDFCKEFLSYWSSSPNSPVVLSLLNPVGPSRKILACKNLNSYVVSDEGEELANWVMNWKQLDRRKPIRLTSGLLLWMERSPLPSEYPKTASEIAALSAQAGLDQEFRSLLLSDSGEVIVVLGAQTADGPGLVAMVLRPALVPKGGPQVARELTLHHGFRPGKVPNALMELRRLGNSRIVRTRVERIDADWIHGRGVDPDARILRGKRVVVIGAGSLGAPVALHLAQAGVGSLGIIDPDVLHTANIGRHPLGASCIGSAKATALSERLRREYPHMLDVTWHNADWQAIAQSEPGFLTSADLVVSTVGGWAPEAALNVWRLDRRVALDVLFGWTEPHAVAGHAVGLVNGAGCLGCGMSSDGVPQLSVSVWPEGTGLRGEPACGSIFQPYGPIQMASVCSMVAEAATDILLGRASAPFHRIWAGRERVLKEAGGQWSQLWLDLVSGTDPAGRTLDRDWPHAKDCPFCETGLC